MFEFEEDLETLADDEETLLPEALEPDEIEEVNMYETHQEQQSWLKKSGSWTPIPPPLRVKCIDDSSSPKRIFRPTLDEVKALKDSGLWVVKGEGFEDGDWTVHIQMKGRR